MAKKKGFNWKTFWIVIGTLVGAAAIFCTVVGVMAHCHNVGFVAEIASWFEAAKEVVPENPDETATTTFLNLISRR